MSNAPRDENQIPTIMGTLNTDGSTPTPIKVNATNNSLKVEDNSTGSDLSGDVAYRDENRVPVLIAVSSSDGITPVPIYATSEGKLLIDST